MQMLRKRFAFLAVLALFITLFIPLAADVKA
jgi:hypothetical protein